MKGRTPGSKEDQMDGIYIQGSMKVAAQDVGPAQLQAWLDPLWKYSAL